MPNVVDLFCGCGGLSLGFQKSGFTIVGAFDKWEKAVNIYNANFTSHKAETIDVYDLTPDYIRSLKPDLIIGGPPCQDYSSAGKHDETRGRANLTIRYAELICIVKPMWFVMENVDRITKSRTLPQAIEMLKHSGYGLSKVVLDASLCGTPQKRKRFFMIGELYGKDSVLETYLLNGQAKKSMTIRDYFGDELQTNFYYRHPRSYARRGVFSIDEPSPTIRGVNRPIPSNYKFHANDATFDLSEIRSLTTLERSRIQTFPKDFVFEGNKTDLEQMIGNAVPVELSAYVAHHLLAYMNDAKVIEHEFSKTILIQTSLDSL